MGLGLSELIVVIAAIIFMFGGKKVVDWVVKFNKAKEEVLVKINDTKTVRDLKNAEDNSSSSKEESQNSSSVKNTVKLNEPNSELILKTKRKIEKVIFVDIAFNGDEDIRRALGSDRAYFVGIDHRILDIDKSSRKKHSSFAVVRNPFERLVCAYLFLNNPLLITPDGKKVSMFHPDTEKIKGKSFDEFIELLITGKLSHISFKQDQSYHIIDKNKNILVDTVLRFENLEKDFAKLCRENEFLDVKLDLINNSRQKDYSKYYAESTQKKVSEFYKRDIELFGYIFGS